MATGVFIVATGVFIVPSLSRVGVGRGRAGGAHRVSAPFIHHPHKRLQILRALPLEPTLPGSTGRRFWSQPGWPCAVLWEWGWSPVRVTGSCHPPISTIPTKTEPSSCCCCSSQPGRAPPSIPCLGWGQARAGSGRGWWPCHLQPTVHPQLTPGGF